MQREKGFVQVFWTRLAARLYHSIRVRAVFSFIVLAALWQIGSLWAESSKVVENHELLSEDYSVPSRSSDEMLLIASHGSLVWYRIADDTVHVLHQGAGVYYGTFLGDETVDGNPSVWVSLRRDEKGQPDVMLQLDAVTGIELKTVPLHSKFTHDAVRSKDGRSVFVADTASGSVHMLSYPDMKLMKNLSLFTRADHINTLCTTSSGTVWAMLHRRGKSTMVELDPLTGETVTEVLNVGEHAHGIVELGKEHKLVLSSKEMSLVLVPIGSGEKQVLWKYAGAGKFLKGLVVMDQVAYFGISKMESRKGRANVDCSLIAFDVVKQTVLWIRSNPGTRGLINTISAPHVAIDSTCVHTTWRNSKLQFGSGIDKLIQHVRKRSVPRMKLPGYMFLPEMETEPLAECSSHYMQLIKDGQQSGHAYGTTQTSFYELPLEFDVQKLQEEVKWLSTTFGWTLRKDVNNYFVLLINCKGIVDDEATYGPFLPVKGRLSETPYIRQVLDSFKSVVGRSRLMMLPAQSTLKRHQDRTSHVYSDRASGKNGYWGRRFRVHIPVFSDPSVKFISNNNQVHMKEGRAYLFDNSRSHSVTNPSGTDRVHLIFDTVGSAELFAMIQSATWIEDESKPPIQTYSNRVSVKPDADGRYDILTEQWIDQDVFKPMRPEIVRGYLIGYLMPLVNAGTSRESLKRQIAFEFSDFVKEWKNAVTQNDDTTDEQYRKMGFNFLRSIVAIECVEGKVELGFRNSENVKVSTLSLSNAVDALVRMLYYECTGWSEHPLHDTSRGPLCFNGAQKRKP